MTGQPPATTNHFHQRLEERGISMFQVQVAMAHGATVVEDAEARKLEHEGLTIVQAHDGALLTAYHLDDKISPYWAEGQYLLALGLIEGITNEDYHASPGVSKSGLDKIAKSPAHYQAYLRGVREETPALRMGRLIHWAVLEPEDCKLVVMPEGLNRRTKAGKEKYVELKVEAAEGCAELVAYEEAQQLNAIRESVLSHTRARSLLFADGLTEASCWWNDQDTGQLCRCRPDRVLDAGWVVDLKSTEDASPEAFAKSCANYRYHVQEAFYRDGVAAATGQVLKGFIFVVVEKSPPHAVACYRLQDWDVDLGRRIYKRDLRRLAECNWAQDFPGYSDKILRINLPAWATKED